MRPEDVSPAPPSAAWSEAGGLYRELTAVYDALEGHLAAAAWDAAAALVPRLDALETALRPLADARRAASPAEGALWAAVDELALGIERRKAGALRLATAARAATAARLADLHAMRTHAARYRGGTPGIAVFASRRA